MSRLTRRILAVLCGGGPVLGNFLVPLLTGIKFSDSVFPLWLMWCFISGLVGGVCATIIWNYE